VDLIYLAIYPPSIITAYVHPPSRLAFELCNSETRVCLSAPCRWNLGCLFERAHIPSVKVSV